MNTALFAKLQAQGKCVYYNAKPNVPISSGCMVTTLRPDICSNRFLPYSIELVKTLSQRGSIAQTASLHFTAAAPEKKKTSLELPLECFRYTGIDIKLNYWQRGGKSKKAKRIKTSSIFEWYQAKEEALVKKEIIKKDRYDYNLKALPPIMIDAASLTTAVCNEKEQQLPYKITRKEAFAVPDVCTHTSKTMVLMVFWKQTYEHWVEGEGWQTYQPDGFFCQQMQVFTPAGQPISEIHSHWRREGYKVTPFYRHALGEGVDMELPF